MNKSGATRSGGQSRDGRRDGGERDFRGGRGGRGRGGGRNRSMIDIHRISSLMGSRVPGMTDADIQEVVSPPIHERVREHLGNVKKIRFISE